MFLNYYQKNNYTLLLTFSLILFSNAVFAKQATYALVAPYLDYKTLGNKHPASNLARFAYSAFRTGLADHSLQLKEQGYNLSFKEASPPSALHQENLQRFYELTAKEKDLWIEKQNIAAITWLELPKNLDTLLENCQPNVCFLSYRIFIHYPDSFIYSVSNKTKIDANNLTLSTEERKKITSSTQNFLNQLWNNCASKDSQRVFPATICGKEAKQLTGLEKTYIRLVDPRLFNLKSKPVENKENIKRIDKP